MTQFNAPDQKPLRRHRITPEPTVRLVAASIGGSWVAGIIMSSGSETRSSVVLVVGAFVPCVFAAMFMITAAWSLRGVRRAMVFCGGVAVVLGWLACAYATKVTWDQGFASSKPPTGFSALALVLFAVAITGSIVQRRPR